MAASSGNDSGGVITGINVTPLVDVMLVLLIIFMVTAKLVIAPTTALRPRSRPSTRSPPH